MYIIIYEYFLERTYIMLFLLLFCLLFCQSYVIQSAPFTFKEITNTKEPSKLTQPASSDEDDYDADDEQSDDDDDFYTDLDTKASFRTKLTRTMRSIKKHTTLIISTVGFCVVGYMYWYKIWPFSKTLPATESSNTTAETSVNPAQESNQESNKKPVLLNKEENITALPQQNQMNAKKENEFKTNLKEMLENESKKYESSESLQVIFDQKIKDLRADLKKIQNKD
jgi:hypothetical protein